MPSSKKDGFTPKWEYVYFFTKKSKSYYFDLDSIRKPLAESSTKRKRQKNIPSKVKSMKYKNKKYNGVYSELTSEESEKYGSPRARNMRDRPYNENNPHVMRDNPEKYIAMNPDRPMDLSHPDGANPGDVLFDDTHDIHDEMGCEQAGYCGV